MILLHRSLPLLSRLMAVALIAGALVVAAPRTPAAQAATMAGSIVFIKNHNVWVSRPDGSGQRALTTNGTSSSPWRSPDQSDVGTVVATRGTRVYRMNQWGTELNSIDPPDLRSSGDELIGGRLTHVTISPDGSKITYTYEKFSCPPGLPPKPCKMRWVTGITAANRFTPATNYGVMYYDHPTWLTNSRLMLNGGGFDQMYLFDVARGPMFWFHEGMYPGSDFKALADGAVSRNGALMVTVRGEFQDARIRTYALPGNPRSGGVPALPEPACETDTMTGFNSPTFAPDSSALAWEQPNGIWIKEDPIDCSVPAVLTIPSAKQPAWSASGYQTRRPAPITFGLTKAPKITGSAKAGRTLRVSAAAWTSVPSSTTYRWYRNGRAIGGATKSSYKVKKADRKRKLSVKVTVRKSGYATRTVATKSVRVKRGGHRLSGRWLAAVERESQPRPLVLR